MVEYPDFDDRFLLGLTHATYRVLYSDGDAFMVAQDGGSQKAMNCRNAEEYRRIMHNLVDSFADNMNRAHESRHAALSRRRATSDEVER